MRKYAYSLYKSTSLQFDCSVKLFAQSTDSAKVCTSNLSNSHTLYGEFLSAWCTTWHGVCTKCMHNRACLLHVKLLWSTARMHVRPCCKYKGYLKWSVSISIACLFMQSVLCLAMSSLPAWCLADCIHVGNCKAVLCHTQSLVPQRRGLLSDRTEWICHVQ